MHILIVEDDPQLGAGLKTWLSQDGYTAEWVRDAIGAEEALDGECFSAAILDIGLPGRSGLALLREMRREDVWVPVLILTARDGLSNKVAGLDAGADDYLTKPVDLPELSARLRALIRRSQVRQAQVLRAGDLALDTRAREAALGTQPISLSPKEYALLEALMCKPGEVVSRDELQTLAYGCQDEIESNALEVHVHNLRRKVGKERIVTVRGAGYRLVAAKEP